MYSDYQIRWKMSLGAYTFITYLGILSARLNRLYKLTNLIYSPISNKFCSMRTSRYFVANRSCLFNMRRSFIFWVFLVVFYSQSIVMEWNVRFIFGIIKEIQCFCRAFALFTWSLKQYFTSINWGKTSFDIDYTTKQPYFFKFRISSYYLKSLNKCYQRRWTTGRDFFFLRWIMIWSF